MHFLDHEILYHLRGITHISTEELGKWIRTCIMVSPLPAIVPISVHHEDERLSRLVCSFHPAIKNSLLSIAGTGSGPRENLEDRRDQYGRDRDIFTSMFDAAQDEAVDLYAAAWERKNGSTSAYIRRWWHRSWCEGDSDLEIELKISSLRDSQKERVIYALDEIGRRPLIGKVVATELSAYEDIFDEISQRSLPYDLGRILTRQWARAYASDLRSVLVSDLPAGSIHAYVDRDFLSVSLKQACYYLDLLGIYHPMVEVSISELSQVLGERRTEHYQIAETIFGALIGIGGRLETIHRAAALVRSSRAPDVSLSAADRLRGAIDGAVEAILRSALAGPSFNLSGLFVGGNVAGSIDNNQSLTSGY
ncbi:hypothetical protein CR970_02325 [Candidatus Saccharibacteria bacterium]|nr:MAG: hypothetical protein CR970_02325 [Candidatus Saccharibacteria bacterium]